MKKLTIDLQKLVGSRFWVGLVISLSRGIPAWAGYRIADLAARVIAANKNSHMGQAVRANQWMVSGGRLSRAELNRRVYQIFRTNVRCLYDYYHNMDRPEVVRGMVDFDPDFVEVLQKIESGDHPAIFLMPHLSNYDLAGRALALYGLKFQVLSYPQPPEGYQLANQLRQEGGMEVTPMSVQAVQQARNRLRAGGVVLTGVDRPLGNSRYFPRFFGRPAHVPVAYIQLALQVRVPVFVVSCIQTGGGKYKIVCSPELVLQPSDDREEELLRNAELVLAEVEKLIRAYPIQWAMFYPVWPEALEEIRRL